MILDERTEFADSAQPAAGIFGDVIDTQQGGPTAAGALPLQARNLGVGMPIYFVFQQETASGGGPLTVELRSDDAVGLATGQIILLSATGLVVTVAPKILFAAPLPIRSDYKRYIGVFLSGTAATAGTCSAYLTLDVAAWQSYQDATN